MPFPRRALGVVLACLLVGMAGPAQGHPAAAEQQAAARPPVKLPANPQGLTPPKGLPSDLDPAPEYQPQTGCAAKAMPGILRLRTLALATYGRGGTSPATPRACTDGGQSEHKDGRAWDWMLNVSNKADRTAAADFLSWLTGPGPSGQAGEMASRLGVMYVIYNHKIWAAYSPGWRPYTGADPHTSHIHISLTWNGARAHTSFWTGRMWPTDVGTCVVFTGQPSVVATKHPRTKPCPESATAPLGSSRPLAWIGSAGQAVDDAQALLGVPDSGRFDAPTRAAVLAYQRTHDLPRTGALDDPTWASLDPATSTLHVPAWTPRTAVQWAHAQGDPTIHRGGAGKAVYALQTALRLDPSVRNGFYGQQTRVAVVALKESAGLPASALVNADVWALLPLAT
ncbi:MAG TPA: peptidoglycan-binding domain-containing protein [Nocardioidaceae bacterium]|nr:peptidoglycan-binding domain-containing protein [Nocardioidaceae bacterium]